MLELGHGVPTQPIAGATPMWQTQGGPGPSAPHLAPRAVDAEAAVAGERLDRVAAGAPSRQGLPGHARRVRDDAGRPGVVGYALHRPSRDRCLLLPGRRRFPHPGDGRPIPCSGCPRVQLEWFRREQVGQGRPPCGVASGGRTADGAPCNAGCYQAPACRTGSSEMDRTETRRVDGHGRTGGDGPWWKALPEGGAGAREATDPR